MKVRLYPAECCKGRYHTADVVVHPGFDTAFPVTVHGMCRHSDDGCVFGPCACLFSANGSGSLKAVHLGHFYLASNPNPLEPQPNSLPAAPAAQAIRASTSR